ncbi:MAG TPA: peptide-methionine (S)-S-oxide reductase MsrA [Fimbriiglobus sp.]|jgi:peptide-methionine (S)-S-oxide reductase
MKKFAYVLIPAGLALLVYLAVTNSPDDPLPENFPTLSIADTGGPKDDGPQLATFASGCFWCSEAVFLRRKGVTKVVPGYCGGTVPDPTYLQVCTGETGHAEAIQVTFDPKAVSYAELLELFWRSHDPTAINRQGYDVGTQYRSVIFTHTETQRRLAEKYKALIDDAHIFSAPVATQIVPYTAFYPAEADHLNYFAKNPNRGYCQNVIRPKLEKLKKVFADKWKTD